MNISGHTVQSGNTIRHMSLRSCYALVHTIQNKEDGSLESSSYVIYVINEQRIKNYDHIFICYRRFLRYFDSIIYGPSQPAKKIIKAILFK